MLYKKLYKLELAAVLFTSVLIALLYSSLNFNYLTKWIDEKGDCLTYDYYVRLGIPQYLYNPHHIGFDWVGEQMFKKLRENGYKGTSMVVLQIRNLIVSSLGLGILFFLFYKITRKYLLSLLTLLLIAFSAAYWMYSQINDTPIIHSILVFVLFLLALYYPQAKNKALFSAILGILHAITIFFHQSDLIMMSAVVFIIVFRHLFPDTGSLHLHFDPIMFRNLAIYLGLFAVIVVTAYYYVGIVLIGLTLDKHSAGDFNNIKGSSYFFNWLILYAKIDYWGKGFEDMSLFQKAIHGISTYLYQPQSFNGEVVKHDFSRFFAPASILPNLLGSLFVCTIGGSLLLFRKMFKMYGYAFIAVLIYMTVYTAFTCWWEADYREFWVAPMFSFWFLMLLFFNLLLNGKSITEPLKKTFSYTFLTLIALLLFYFNFTGFIRPNIGTTYKTYDITR